MNKDETPATCVCGHDESYHHGPVPSKTHCRHVDCLPAGSCPKYRPAPPPSPQQTDDVGEAVKRVQQDDAHGCGVAVLAMLTLQPYQQVKSDLIKLGIDRDLSERGIDYEQVNEYLRQKGFATAKRWLNNPFGKKPDADFPATFGSIHYALVEQHSGNWHFIVVMGDGTILDPLTDEPKTFADYKRVSSVTAVYNVAALAERNRTLEAEIREAEAAVLEYKSKYDAEVTENIRLRESHAAAGGQEKP